MCKDVLTYPNLFSIDCPELSKHSLGLKNASFLNVMEQFNLNVQLVFASLGV